MSGARTVSTLTITNDASDVALGDVTRSSADDSRLVARGGSAEWASRAKHGGGVYMAGSGSRGAKGSLGASANEGS